jgi:hypothetical protein
MRMKSAASTQSRKTMIRVIRENPRQDLTRKSAARFDRKNCGKI